MTIARSGAHASARPMLAAILASCAALLAIELLGVLALPVAWREAAAPVLFSESGAVEILTVVLYLALCVAVWRSLDAPLTVRLALIYLVLLLVLRELDFDSRWTETSAMRTKFLFSSQYPAGQRLVAGVVLGVGALCGLFLVFRAGPAALRSLRRGGGAALLAAIGFLCLPLAKLMDGGLQIIRGWLGLARLSPTASLLSHQWEETLEMLAPAAFIMAIFLLRRERHEDKGQAA